MAIGLKVIPHLDYTELTKRYKACKEPKERSRWLAIRLLSRPNRSMSIEEVANIVGFSPDWIRKIVRRYNQHGPDSLVDGHQKNPGGKKYALTEEQQKQLFERLQKPPDDGGLWSGPKVGELIKQVFGIKVHRTTGWDYLKRLGFTLQVPRPKHLKSATPEEEAAFKASFQNFVRLMRWLCPHLSVEVWTEDEARLGLKPIMRRTWALKGQRPVAHHYPRYKWLYTYGFVNPKTGENALFILPRVNLTAMQIALKAFAEQVNPHQKKLIILLLDQAGWHRSKKLALPKNLIMYPLPAYTPSLNPTECIWPLLREPLANKAFDNLDELETVLSQRCVWLMNNPGIVRGATGFKWLRDI